MAKKIRIKEENIDNTVYHKDPEKEILNTNEIEEKYTCISKKNTIISKMNQLYITIRYSYYSTSYPNNSYTIQQESSLTDYRVERHLLHENTVHCHPRIFLTKWFSINISNSNEADPTIIQANTKKVTNALAAYIPSQYIYCYTDGLGGYIVIVYLQDFEKIRKIYKFKNHIWSLFELATINKYRNIEMRPLNSEILDLHNTIMLPLGVNFLNTNSKTRYCFFVDINTLEPVTGQYQYFLNIKRLPSKIFYKKTMLATRNYNLKFKKKL